MYKPDTTALALPATIAPLYAGLTNTGNTCFLNATLAGLSSLDAFVDEATSQPTDRVVPNSRLLDAYSKMLQRLREPTRDGAPHDAVITGIYENLPGKFRDNQQHDAAELLITLLEATSSNERVGISAL